MIERGLWHPVALAADLATTPLGVHLLDEPLVLWRDPQGAPYAWADRCPHRGAQLSLGCVREGQLECPYHGWRFEGSGRVVLVPALPGFEPPPATHRAATHEAREQHGMLWVRLALPAAEVSIDDIPAFDAESDPHLRKLNCGPYDVAASAPRIVENFLDMAHFGFVHEGGLGSRDHTTVAPYWIEPTATGFVASGCKAWQPKSSLHAHGGAMVEYRYEVNAPYAAVLTKLPDPASVAIEGFRESIALYVCPVTPEASRVWFRVAVNDFDSPDATLQDFQRRIFLQDRSVLESQRPKRLPVLESASSMELHCAADRSSVAYRRHLRERGITFGVC